LAGCGVLGNREPVVMRVAITSSTAPLMDDVLGAYQRVAPNVSFDITRGNAETVISALNGGSADWGLVTSLPAESDLWSAPVGTDTLAVVAHTDSPVAGLTQAQIRAIYQGHTLNWEELSGPDLPVVIVGRESGSAARGAFDELVMGGLLTTPAARLATNGEAVLAYVGQEPGAIGYVSLALVDSRVRSLAIDGVPPSQAAAREGSYPLTSTLRFVARAEPDGPASGFLAWLLSDEGQSVVAQRYAPLVR
jgi:phosphate transport system substrate-binding protein